MDSRVEWSEALLQHPMRIGPRVGATKAISLNKVILQGFLRPTKEEEPDGPEGGWMQDGEEKDWVKHKQTKI